MSISDIYGASDAIGLSALIRQGDVSAKEIVEEGIRRIEALNGEVNAVIYKAYDYARKLAGEPLPESPLAGVPFLLKDLSLEWEGFPVTNACAYFRDYKAKSDWEIAKRMKRAGLIPLGKTNAPENGWAGTTEPALYGPTRNPWRADIVPGGSSGGSSVAVATGMVPIADASDGGGSIRIPASINGLVGLKPSRGRVTFGPDLVDFWYGAAVFLCVSRTVRDTAAYLDAIAGAVEGEPYALAKPDQPYLSVLEQPRRKLRIGFVTSQPDGSPLQGELEKAVTSAVTACKELGHDVQEAEFRYDTRSMGEFFVRITAANAAAFFDAAPAMVGREVRESDVEPVTWGIIQLGRKLSAAQHAADIEKMRVMARKIVQDTIAYDALVSPVLTNPSRPLGWYDMQNLSMEDYNARLVGDVVFTAPFNISGQPAITLPLHMTGDGLPVGVQFAGRLGDEATLLALAGQLEKARPWKDRRPPLRCA